MAIIKHINTENINNDLYMNIFPDQYVSTKEKQTDEFIKGTMDYFSHIAINQFNNKKDYIERNYSILNGIIDKRDFYEEPVVKDFTETLEESMKLPSYVQHYSILNQPINTMIGELTRRPDNSVVKAMDDDSQAEELQYKTDILKQYLSQVIQNKIVKQLSSQGININDIQSNEELSQQFQEMTAKELQEQMSNYTSKAESWGNHILDACKVGFNLKELSEEAFGDLLKVSEQYYHIYEDNSKLGFNVEVLNPKYKWGLTTEDKKYSKDEYASGIIRIMEMSEVINRYDLTIEEIDNLRENYSGYNQYGLGRESNLVKSNPPTGADSIFYETYSPLMQRERMMAESRLLEGENILRGELGLVQNNGLNTFGNKVVVVEAYWQSKTKIGKLTYWDPETQSPQTVLVSEDYKKIPGQISIEWGYMNQWYKGRKIGTEIYHVEPFNLFNYNPIIGVRSNAKNSQPRSFLDLMKKFQVIYDICINQLYELLQKDIGKVFVASIRYIPRQKDQSGQDALDQWEMTAREKGLIFLDDSPENLKGQSSFNQFSTQDMSRTNEIQARYNLAVQIKQECWDMVGISRQRTGEIQASETATATNAALSQSYTQTEAYFVQHEYVLNQLYQGIIDAAQYVESRKPQSTVSYINGIGESCFIQVNGSEIKLRDLQVFVTNRAKDQRIFNQLQQLSQAMLQNGASIYDISLLYTTDSLREMMNQFKELRDKNEDMLQRQQQMKEQELQNQQEQFKIQQEEAERVRQEDNAREDWNKKLDRENNKEIAMIKSLGYGKVQGEDENANNVPDIMELSNINTNINKANKDYDIKMREINADNNKMIMENRSKEEDRKLERENMKNDVEVAKINASNRKNNGK